MNDVLVLNRNYYAIQIVDWKKAMSLMYQGLADAVDEQYVNHSFENWVEISKAMEKSPNGFVSSPKFKVAVPDIIRLNHFDRLPKREVKFSRRNIYQHYGYKCCYCNKQFKTEELNLDHVFPRSRGGRTDWTNIVTSCLPCNSKKMDRTPEEAGMKLLVKPSRPAWKGAKSFIDFPSGQAVRVAWQKVIDACYWDSELNK